MRFLFHYVEGNCGQMGAFVKQPGTRVSEIEVSIEPILLCNFLLE